MSRHRNMKQMIEEDYYDDYYDDDDDYYDDYDDSYVAPAANKKKQQQQQKQKQIQQQQKNQQKQKQQQQQQKQTASTQSTPTKSVTPTKATGGAATIGTPNKAVGAADTPNKVAESPATPSILLKKANDSTKQQRQRTHLTVVVLGHVDAGKSTITGHLLYHSGNNNASRHPNKQLNYAWLLDEDEQERAHGITMDVATKTLQTPKFNLVLCDAPGHADYVPAAITGAAAADAALLTVGSTDFRASFGAGQLREHALLARGLGVNSLLVAVSKMDLVEWKEDAYRAIVDPLQDFLVTQVGFAAKKVRCVPVSGLTGENMFKAPSSASWYQGPTLWQALDAFEAPANQQGKLLEKPARVLLTDVTSAGSVRAKVVQGWIQAGEDLVVWPVGDDTRLTKLKRLTADLEEENPTRSQYAAAGEMFDCVVAGVDPTRLSPGHILTRRNQRPPLSKSCRAKVWLLSSTNMPTVIIKGAQVTFHMHHLDVPCHFSKLVRTLKKDGSPGKERPRALTSNNTPAAVVELQLLIPICMEAFTDCRALGRFVLRRAGDSIAVGRIEQVL